MIRKLNRQAQTRYLHAMGVQVWYAREGRSDLKPSSSVAAASEVLESVAVEQMFEIVVESPLPIADAQPGEKSTIDSRTASRKRTAPRFDLVAMRCTDRLLVIGDIAKTNNQQLTSAQSRLLTELVSALGLSAAGAKYNHFTWPFSTSEHSDQSESVAVDAVWGFYNAQIAKQKVGAVLILGSLAARYLLPDEMQLVECRGKLWAIENYPALATCGIDKMLENPLLKREVWREVQPVIKLLEEVHAG